MLRAPCTLRPDGYHHSRGHFPRMGGPATVTLCVGSRLGRGRLASPRSILLRSPSSGVHVAALTLGFFWALTTKKVGLGDVPRTPERHARVPAWTHPPPSCCQLAGPARPHELSQISISSSRGATRAVVQTISVCSTDERNTKVRWGVDGSCLFPTPFVSSQTAFAVVFVNGTYRPDWMSPLPA